VEGWEAEELVRQAGGPKPLRKRKEKEARARQKKKKRYGKKKSTEEETDPRGKEGHHQRTEGKKKEPRPTAEGQPRYNNIGGGTAGKKKGWESLVHDHACKEKKRKKRKKGNWEKVRIKKPTLQENALIIN